MIEKLFKLWLSLPLNKKVMVISGEEFSKVNNKIWGRNKNEILKLDVFEKDPQRLWDWSVEKRRKINKIKPSLEYISLVKLESFFNDNFILLTDNIDGLHLKSGNYRIIETMGNIFENKIYKANKEVLSEADILNIQSLDVETIYKENAEESSIDTPFIIRPNIVLEGEDNERIKYLQGKNFAEQTDVIILLGNTFKKSYLYDIPILTKKYKKDSLIINISKKRHPLEDLYIDTNKINYLEILPILVSLIIDIEIGIRLQIAKSKK